MENFWENYQSPELLLILSRKWPKNLTSDAHILHTFKRTCTEHVKQYWYESSESFLRKWPKTLTLTYFGAQNGPKFGPLRPIFYTPLKVLAISTWSNTAMKPVKTFWESDQGPEFLLTLGSKMAPKLGRWYCAHLSKWLQWAYKARLVWIQRKV